MAPFSNCFRSYGLPLCQDINIPFHSHLVLRPRLIQNASDWLQQMNFILRRIAWHSLEYLFQSRILYLSFKFPGLKCRNCHNIYSSHNSIHDWVIELIHKFIYFVTTEKNTECVWGNAFVSRWIMFPFSSPLILPLRPLFLVIEFSSLNWMGMLIFNKFQTIESIFDN